MESQYKNSAYNPNVYKKLEAPGFAKIIQNLVAILFAINSLTACKAIDFSASAAINPVIHSTTGAFDGAQAGVKVDTYSSPRDIIIQQRVQEQMDKNNTPWWER